MAMDENVRDNISNGFAELTSLIEDAATIAVAGQSQRQSMVDMKELIKSIWPILISCNVVLSSLERIIEDEDTS